MLLYIVSTLTFNTIGFEHNLYHYAGAPDVPLSDMNGMGRFWIGRAWFQAYWLAFALMLLVVVHLMWRRGADDALRPRFARMLSRLRGRPARLRGAAAVAGSRSARSLLQHECAERIPDADRGREADADSRRRCCRSRRSRRRGSPTSS
jgi:hypothetical protein